MRRLFKNHSGVAMIIVVFAVMLFAMMGAVLTSMQGIYFETARSHLRSSQVFFIVNSGIERGKQKMQDNPLWTPSSPPGYLREYMTVGGARGHYDVYVVDLGAGTYQLQAESQMDTQ